MQISAQARVMADREWQLELSGEVTKQRRIEAVDKLLSVLTLIVAAVFGLQAIGLDGALELHLHLLEPALPPSNSLMLASLKQVHSGVLWRGLDLHLLTTDCAGMQSTRCWLSEEWVVWRWVWLAGRSWRTCLRGSSSCPAAPLRSARRSTSRPPPLGCACAASCDARSLHAAEGQGRYTYEHMGMVGSSARNCGSEQA